MRDTCPTCGAVRRKPKAPKGSDGRERHWRVRVQFYRAGVLQAESDFERVEGTRGVAELVAYYAERLGVEGFDGPAIERAMHNARSAISRGGGKHTLRRVSADGMTRLFCVVQREDCDT